MSKGMVHGILTKSSVANLGEHAVIFMQGCNFNCIYCNVPERINHCSGCGFCIESCTEGALTLGNNGVEFNPELCTWCNDCIRACGQNSTPRTQSLSPMQIMKIIAKKREQISGITVSGGECSLQQDFLSELFKLAKSDGLARYIISNGSLHYKPDFLALCDGVTLSVKVYDNALHQVLTGKENAQVLQNLYLLARQDKLYEVQTVVVPGLIDNHHNIKELSKLISTVKADVRFKLIRFSSNNTRCELTENSIPNDELMNELLAIAANEGCSKAYLC